jgi:predicted enzyme related to lactoylglutathione lyase
MISGVSKVVIDVGDQELAKAFWTETMGFEVIQDTAYREERWLEVQPPGGSVSLVLELRGEGTVAHVEAPEDLPTSRVMFRCDDLPGTYRELAARGVEFPQPPVHQPFGWWSTFNDSEGNRFGLQQEADAS